MEFAVRPLQFDPAQSTEAACSCCGAPYPEVSVIGHSSVFLSLTFSLFSPSHSMSFVVVYSHRSHIKLRRRDSSKPFVTPYTGRGLQTHSQKRPRQRRSYVARVKLLSRHRGFLLLARCSSTSASLGPGWSTASSDSQPFRFEQTAHTSSSSGIARVRPWSCSRTSHRKGSAR